MPDAWDEAVTPWVCGAICPAFSVTCSSPASSPWVRLLSPGPCPKLIAVRPRRSGSPKVTRPSPPYMVPRSENRALFWEIDIVWP